MVAGVAPEQDGDTVAIMQRILHGPAVAILLATAACATPDADVVQSGASNARDIVLPIQPAPPAYDGPPFRQGPIALGGRTHYVPPDLSDLPPLPRASQVILEVQIDISGNVVSARVLRGLRDDIDARVVEAVRQWRYEPARLRQTIGRLDDTTWPAGTVVPAYFTVAPRVPDDVGP